MLESLNNEKLKSYWNRPGGKFGIVAAVGLLFVFVSYIMPILAEMVWDTFNFGIGLLCLGCLLYVVSHRKLRLSLFYLYEILMKQLVGLVIELDPFIVAEDYLQDMEKQREQLHLKSLEVDTQKEKLALKIEEKETEMKKLLTRAQVAKDRGMMPEVSNAMRQVGRLEEYIKQLSPIHEGLASIGDYLTKVHKNSAYLIEDSRNELEIKKDLYRSVTSGNKALNSALKIFKGDPEKKLMVEQSMEYLKEDIASKLANMKKAILYSNDFMQSIDLDNATFELQGLKKLETFNPESDFQLSNVKVSKFGSEAIYENSFKALLD